MSCSPVFWFGTSMSTLPLPCFLVRNILHTLSKKWHFNIIHYDHCCHEWKKWKPNSYVCSSCHLMPNEYTACINFRWPLQWYLYLHYFSSHMYSTVPGWHRKHTPAPLLYCQLNQEMEAGLYLMTSGRHITGSDKTLLRYEMHHNHMPSVIDAGQYLLPYLLCS